MGYRQVTARNRGPIEYVYGTVRTGRTCIYLPTFRFELALRRSHRIVLRTFRIGPLPIEPLARASRPFTRPDGSRLGAIRLRPPRTVPDRPTPGRRPSSEPSSCASRSQRTPPRRVSAGACGGARWRPAGGVARFRPPRSPPLTLRRRSALRCPGTLRRPGTPRLRARSRNPRVGPVRPRPPTPNRRTTARIGIACRLSSRTIGRYTTRRCRRATRRTVGSRRRFR